MPGPEWIWVVVVIAVLVAVVMAAMRVARRRSGLTPGPAGRGLPGLGLAHLFGVGAGNQQAGRLAVVAQAFDALGGEEIWVGLAGLEPATERS